MLLAYLHIMSTEPALPRPLTPADGTQAGRDPVHLAIRLHYRARTAAYLNMAALPLLVIVEQAYRPELAAVALWCLLFPHLARFLAPRLGNDRATEHRIMQLDSAHAALVSGLCGFALFPTAVMTLAMLMNALINGGARFGIAQLPYIAVGGLLGAVLGDFSFQWQATLAASIVSVIGLCCYVALVGLNAHAVQLRLRRTRSQLVEKSRQLEEASLTDPLTRARNRRYIASKLAMTERALREPLAFALIDIDHFKRINDQHGHAAGDAVLRELAERLAVLSPAPADVVRWGGEEFLVVAHGVDPARLDALGEAIRQGVIARPFALPDGGSLAVTVSIGLAPYPFGPRLDRLDWTRVIDLADRALYEAKRGGRNTWVLVLPAAREAEPREADVEGLPLQEAERLGRIQLRRAHD